MRRPPAPWVSPGLIGGLLLGLLLPGVASAGEASVSEVKAESETGAAAEGDDDEEETEEKQWVPLFELSLADTQFFAGSSLPDSEEQIIPSSAALFLVEIFLTYRWRILTFFHLPLTPERVIVDGVLESRYSPPALATGFALSPWWMDFRKHRRLEFQVALVGGIFLRKKPRFFPMTALRVYFLHAEDLGLYLGMAYAFAPGTAGLIYGFGYRF